MIILSALSMIAVEYLFFSINLPFSYTEATSQLFRPFLPAIKISISIQHPLALGPASALVLVSQRRYMRRDQCIFRCASYH